MGDMGEIFAAHREYNKLHKAERLAEADRLVGHLFTKLTDHHWRATIRGRVLDYWPSTGTYRWHNRDGRAAIRGRSDQIEPGLMLELITKAQNG